MAKTQDLKRRIKSVEGPYDTLRRIVNRLAPQMALADRIAAAIDRAPRAESPSERASSDTSADARPRSPSCSRSSRSQTSAASVSFARAPPPARTESSSSEESASGPSSASRSDGLSPGPYFLPGAGGAFRSRHTS